ncbi:MAG TPA: aspartate aminotransferase family protein [Euzebyales bacterium]|nr:aspartate aminotransferase family protein [Euzebyales bacterium]
MLTEPLTTAEQAAISTLIAEQERIFLDGQARSAELLARARTVLAGGGTSSWQIARPQMIWLSHGDGSTMTDADGRTYVDMHGGYGVGVAGHGHPAIVEAITGRVPRATHFAQPTPDAIAVGTELARRWGLPLWRFGNSGTEATMDAVHLMRAITGRDRILKVEGCYHGHHDSVMVSVANEIDEIGPATRPTSAPAGTGIPAALTELTTIVGFNDLDAVERGFAEHPGEIAGMIVEPIMMNAGIIPPDDGYLAGLKDVVHAHDALLTFDEVKTGVTTAAGGVTELSGVTPDIVTLAKAMGGGVPCGAIGGTAEVMAFVADGRYEQVGTFNGNPLTMASTRAMLTEVTTPEAYRHLNSLRDQLVEGAQATIDRYGLPAYPLGFGAKGSITFASERVRTYRDFMRIDDQLSHLHWLFQINNGVFLPPWGKDEQWTLSVQHSHDDADRFLCNFAAFAAALRG